MKKILKSLGSIEKLSNKLTEKLLANTKLETQIKLAKVVLPNYYNKNMFRSKAF
ncbi:MAG: hypothetical protein JSS63_07850 [Bacteroidetes bacterium]|nr:hypothetical protein [Bacteroidota bacterium]MBX7044365.1 hypothetical protein [Ignavibacteria bacterium]